MIVAEAPRAPARRLAPLIGLSLALGFSLLAWAGVAALVRVALN